jgi:hypothetical protein
VAISRDDVVAHIEADMHGAMIGGGGQDATVWRDGRIVLGPLHSSGQGAINQALRSMGIAADPAVGEGDEFDTLGLGRYRKTERWVQAEAAGRGLVQRPVGGRRVERAGPASADRRHVVIRRLLGLLARPAGRRPAATRQAREPAHEQTFAVLIIDMFHHDEESDFRIDGFPTAEAAKEFARRWVRDSVEELRAPGQTAAELRNLWFTFGEDVLALGLQYAGSQELDYFVIHPAMPQERDWQSLHPGRQIS